MLKLKPKQFRNFCITFKNFFKLNARTGPKKIGTATHFSGLQALSVVMTHVGAACGSSGVPLTHPIGLAQRN